MSNRSNYDKAAHLIMEATEPRYLAAGDRAEGA